MNKFIRSSQYRHFIWFISLLFYNWKLCLLWCFLFVRFKNWLHYCKDLLHRNVTTEHDGGFFSCCSIDYLDAYGGILIKNRIILYF